jgi:hypothetical protein
VTKKVVGVFTFVRRFIRGIIITKISTLEDSQTNFNSSADQRTIAEKMSAC